MSFWDRFKKPDDERTYRFRGDTQQSYKAEKEALQMEREKLQLRKEIKQTEKEMNRLKHPYREGTYKTVSSGISRAGKFTGYIAGNVGAGYATANRQLNRIKAGKVREGRIRAIKTSRSFTRPDGGDISLSQSIARADWHGERNVMNTEFFGQREERNLLGDQRDKHWDMDIFGTKTTEQNLIGNNVNLRQNKKYY